MKGEIKGCFFVVQHQHQHRENWKITYLYASIKTNKQWPSWPSNGLGNGNNVI